MTGPEVVVACSEAGVAGPGEGLAAALRGDARHAAPVDARVLSNPDHVGTSETHSSFCGK